MDHKVHWDSRNYSRTQRPLASFPTTVLTPPSPPLPATTVYMKPILIPLPGSCHVVWQFGRPSPLNGPDWLMSDQIFPRLIPLRRPGRFTSSDTPTGAHTRAHTQWRGTQTQVFSLYARHIVWMLITCRRHLGPSVANPLLIICVLAMTQGLQWWLQPY